MLLVQTSLLAHTTPGSGAASTLASFGTDWLYVAAPLGLLLAGGALFHLVGRRGGARGLDALLAGAERVSGVPAWSGASLFVLLVGLLWAVEGFFWDVAWHIARGRDEFLFSPPHLCLLLGIGFIGLSGAIAAWLATRQGAEVGWRVGPLRVPVGAAALIAAGATATVGFGVDELWHWAYGLDVTMWSPPHLTMISVAAFSPLAGWLLHAEAGPATRDHLRRWLLSARAAIAGIIGLSAWMLEFDLGVPQWQQLYHPLLVAFAAGFGLCAARVALGPGGALVAMGGFVVVRGVLALLTAQVWRLPEPRFVPYVAAALAVELAFLLVRRGGAVRQGVAAGLGVVTLGVAGAAGVTQLWSWHAWTPSLLRGAPLVVAIGLAAAVLGVAFGRVVSYRPSTLRWPHVAVCLAAIAGSLAFALPREVPDARATVSTTPAGPGRVHVTVRLDPPDFAETADRFEVLAWQGGGLVSADLVPAGAGGAGGSGGPGAAGGSGGRGAVGESGEYRSTEPVPVSGHWKAMVRIARGAELGAIPVYLPADPEISATAAPLVPRRAAAFVGDDDLLLRETHGGPVWPGVAGYTFVASSVLLVIGLLVAGTVALERRRRGHGWTPGDHPLARARAVVSLVLGRLGGRPGRARTSVAHRLAAAAAGPHSAAAGPHSAAAGPHSAADSPLADKRVLLTGAAGGIGAATRHALRAQGARVIGIDLRADEPDTLAADLRDPLAAATAVDEAVHRLGGLDIVIANAGIGVADDSTRPPDGAARDVMEVNFFAAWRVVACALEHLPERGGQVVFVTSGLAHVNMPYAAAYTASKRALAGYADVLRVERRGALAVSVVAPAYIRTAIHDGPRAQGASLDGLARRETVYDAAAVIVAACETRRRHLGTSPLTTLQLWFARHAPALVDRAVRLRWDRVERHRPPPRFGHHGAPRADAVDLRPLAGEHEAGEQPSTAGGRIRP